MMKKLLVVSGVLCLPFFGFAQIIGDSVIVYIDNRVEVKVAVRDYINLKSSEAVIEALTEFVEAIPQVSDQLSAESPDLVNLLVGNSLTVESGEEKAIYLIKEGQVSFTGPRDHAIIKGKRFNIFITTTDLTRIPDISIVQCLEKVLANLPDKSRRSKSLYFECVDDEARLLEVKNNERDFLKFSSNIGAGLVRNTWVPDITLKLAVGLWRKRTIRNPYISLDFLYDFTVENNDELIVFFNLGYQRYLRRGKNNPVLVGIELGYADTRDSEGDLFGKNTLRFGFSWSPSTAIIVNPYFYYTDNFDTAFPGVRVAFAWGR